MNGLGNVEVGLGLKVSAYRDLVNLEKRSRAQRQRWIGHIQSSVRADSQLAPRAPEMYGGGEVSQSGVPRRRGDARPSCITPPKKPRKGAFSRVPWPARLPAGATGPHAPNPGGTPVGATPRRRAPPAGAAGRVRQRAEWASTARPTSACPPGRAGGWGGNGLGHRTTPCVGDVRRLVFRVYPREKRRVAALAAAQISPF